MSSHQQSGDSVPPEVDVERPSPARIYDYWLGGSHNFASDRELGQRMADLVPAGVRGVWVNRAFLRRVVTCLVRECGITQLLDLGSGIPTVGNVHEIAREINPDVRVVYVDIDPVAVAYARHILNGDPRTRVIQGDLRRPATVLADPLLRATIDLDQPLALLMIAVLHFMPDTEQPHGVVRAYREYLTPGSYLALSHLARDERSPERQLEALDDYRRTTGVPFIPRDAEQFRAFLGDFELCEPGVVLAQDWRPDTDTEIVAVPVQVALARKPG